MIRNFGIVLNLEGNATRRRIRCDMGCRGFLIHPPLLASFHHVVLAFSITARRSLWQATSALAWFSVIQASEALG